MAAKVFLNTDASAICWCGGKSLFISSQWKRTADVIKLFNDWFDVFNSKFKFKNIFFKFGYSNSSHAYGINLDEQNEIIANMNESIQVMRVVRRSKLLRFQKEI